MRRFSIVLRSWKFPHPAPRRRWQLHPNCRTRNADPSFLLDEVRHAPRAPQISKLEDKRGPHPYSSRCRTLGLLRQTGGLSHTGPIYREVKPHRRNPVPPPAPFATSTAATIPPCCSVPVPAKLFAWCPPARQSDVSAGHLPAEPSGDSTERRSHDLYR
jgi:hypothetical protein